MKNTAENALRAAISGIWTQEQIAKWNATRNDGCCPQAEAIITDWEDWGDVLTKEFYVQSPNEELTAEYRRALYYPDSKCLVLEDYDRNEVYSNEEVKP